MDRLLFCKGNCIPGTTNRSTLKLGAREETEARLGRQAFISQLPVPLEDLKNEKVRITAPFNLITNFLHSNRAFSVLQQRRSFCNRQNLGLTERSSVKIRPVTGTNSSTWPRPGLVLQAHLRSAMQEGAVTLAAPGPRLRADIPPPTQRGRCRAITPVLQPAHKQDISLANVKLM